MTPLLNLIHKMSNTVSTVIRLSVLLLVFALYSFSFPAILLIEMVGLTIIVTVASFFVGQEELRKRLDGGLVAFSGAILLEDMWYILIKRPTPLHITRYRDFFKYSISPNIFPLAVPIASIFLAPVVYFWALNGSVAQIG